MWAIRLTLTSVFFRKSVLALKAVCGTASGKGLLSSSTGKYSSLKNWILVRVISNSVLWEEFSLLVYLNLLPSAPIKVVPISLSASSLSYSLPSYSMTFSCSTTFTSLVAAWALVVLLIRFLSEESTPFFSHSHDHWCFRCWLSCYQLFYYQALLAMFL